VGGWIASAPSRNCARDPCRSGSGGLPLRLSFRGAAVVGAALLLAACAREVSTAVHPQAPGFLLGLWHGFIFPLSWIGSLFSNDIAIYAVPNNGGWYDFGYFLGIVVFGVGARKSTTVYRDRVVYRDRAIEARKIN
jgi:hypothetical protein